MDPDDTHASLGMRFWLGAAVQVAVTLVLAWLVVHLMFAPDF
jgi:hypothetical protein